MSGLLLAGLNRFVNDMIECCVAGMGESRIESSDNVSAKLAPSEFFYVGRNLGFQAASEEQKLVLSPTSVEASWWTRPKWS